MQNERICPKGKQGALLRGDRESRNREDAAANEDKTLPTTSRRQSRALRWWEMNQ